MTRGEGPGGRSPGEGGIQRVGGQLDAALHLTDERVGGGYAFGLFGRCVQGLDQALGAESETTPAKRGGRDYFFSPTEISPAPDRLNWNSRG